MATIETVKVVCGKNKRLGYKIINKADMKPGDRIYEKPAVRKVAKKPAAKAAPED